MRYLTANNQTKIKVDNEIYNLLKDKNIYKICKTSSGSEYYGFYDCEKKRNVLIHRFVLEHFKGQNPKAISDHINHNTLDNTINNLRYCSAQQNALNRKTRSDNISGLKGAFKNSKGNYYHSKINFNGKVLYLGNFDNPQEAHEKYKSVAKTLFGEYFCEA